MTLVRDLSGNGTGINLNNRSDGSAVDLSVADAIVNGSNRLYATGAGNIILRYPNGNADVTIAVAANSTIPISPGVIVRKTGTTATGLVSVPDLRMRG